MLLAGRFELGERIGEGALSVVHAAVDRASGRHVAIKLAGDVEDLAATRLRFAREAAALAVISSAHVVELISAGATDEGRPFLVLERLAGRNLSEVMAERGALKPKRVVKLVAQAAAALELAHGVGIVHRDLKPANLFLHMRADGTIVLKVLDFGMVVDTAGPTERERDAFGGTPLYMAPEQVRGQLSRIGPATDIWAIALVTLTLLTGEQYWTSTTALEVMREIEASALERPSMRWPWLPPAFDDWFMRSTQRVPERRYRSAAVQAAALGAALQGVEAPDASDAASVLTAASTLAARTPTPSIVRLSARARPVVGREIEHREVEALLGTGKLVTLTGTAGIGKTRLAQVVCEAAAERFLDGAWFVALPAGEGEATIAGAIAHVLELEPDTTRTLLEHVIESLAVRRVLLVLDGVEHVVGGAAVIERLRASCPAASWLVTSRLALGLPGERVHAVEPLDVPTVATLSPEEAETFSGVELFVRSAREASPMFALDERTVDDVVAICRALEGFPLGIEVAAAQLASSGLPQIRAALEESASSSSPVRAAVQWSYGLLAPDQQRMLRQLAVLPAGLTFEQVKRRLGHLSGDPMYAALRLVQTHLAAWSSDQPRRLVMLDTVRELCRDDSRARGEEAEVWRLAREHVMTVATPPTDAVDAWLALLDAEHANLLAVLDHLLDEDPQDAMRLAGQLAYYWYLRGHYQEGARWLDATLVGAPDDGGAIVGRALHGAGRIALLTCRYARAEALLERAREVAQAARDGRGEADAYQLLGSVARERGDYAHARAFHQQSLRRWQQLGDEREAARARNYLAFAAWLGDPTGAPPDDASAWDMLDEDELRRLGDPELTVWTLLNRGAVLYHRRDAVARDVLGRAFAEAIAARFHEGIAWSLDLIGKLSFERGELLQARAQLAAALRVHRRLGDRWRCASVLEALAAVAVASERPARGAVYLGAADAIRQQIGTPVPGCERAMYERTERDGVVQIGDAFLAGRERGRRTPLDQVVELARDVG